MYQLYINYLYFEEVPTLPEAEIRALELANNHGQECIILFNGERVSIIPPNQ